MGSAADFISGLPRDLQESFLTYCTLLVEEFQNVRSQLVDENGSPLNPILIRDACFVAFGEAKECPKLLIAPKEQLDQLHVRTGMKPSASVFLRESKAHAALLANLSDKTAFNALIAETALNLLSGEHALSRWKSGTTAPSVRESPGADRKTPPAYASTQVSTSSGDNIAQAKRILDEKGYQVKHRDYGWLIIEPLGGRQKILSVSELHEYALSRDKKQ